MIIDVTIKKRYPFVRTEPSDLLKRVIDTSPTLKSSTFVIPAKFFLHSIFTSIKNSTIKLIDSFAIIIKMSLPSFRNQLSSVKYC